MIAFIMSSSENVSPSFRYTCEPPISAALREVAILSLSFRLPSASFSATIIAIIILASDAVGHGLCSLFSKITIPLTGSIKSAAAYGSASLFGSADFAAAVAGRARR